MKITNVGLRFAQPNLRADERHKKPEKELENGLRKLRDLKDNGCGVK